MNKKKHLLFIFLFLLGMSMILASCGKKKEEPVSTIKEKAEGKEEKEETVVVPPVSTEGILYGIIIETGENRILLQSDRGNSIRLELDKEVDLSGLEKGLELGEAVKVEYSGKIKGSSAKGVEVEKIIISDKISPLPKEALALAGEIITAFRDKDLKKLSKLCEYPLIYDRGEKKTIRTEEAFQGLKKEAVFDRKLGIGIAKTNLFMTNPYSQGFLLGDSEPNLIVQNTKKGWKITAFHYQ